MITVSDILKILDKIPIWKQLKDLPARIEALERRLEALEQDRTAVKGEKCPSCGAYEFMVTATKPHPLMGEVGIKERTYTCSGCGFTEPRITE